MLTYFLIVLPIELPIVLPIVLPIGLGGRAGLVLAWGAKGPGPGRLGFEYFEET